MEKLIEITKPIAQSDFALWNNPNSLIPRKPDGSESLAQERGKATFDVKDLSVFIHGREELERMERLTLLLESEPVFSKDDQFFKSRTERFRQAMKKSVRLIELEREHNWTYDDWWTAASLNDEPGPILLHHSMFIPTILGQGSDEQKELWLPLAKEYKIIGCYSQTELGHGSNIQGLETTASYNEKTEEFEINSPTLTAAKWWAGGLGRTATHAIVVARLILKNRDLGTHNFVIQIRSTETFKPLPGIIIGDIGPKYGYQAIDNGFMLFDHIRVPRNSMLMRFAQVQPDGTYVQPPNAKLSYGTMVQVRTRIVKGAAAAIARSAVIATRYSAIRRQFSNPEASKDDEIFNAMNQAIHSENLLDHEQVLPSRSSQPIETAILDYSIQKTRIITGISKAFALHSTGKLMSSLYSKLQLDLEKGDLSLLAETHATSSGLKSVTTDMATEVMEDLRRSCGGHGYSQFSGFPDFIANYLPNVTYEGDNHLLTQQTTRYLLKTYDFLKLTAAKPGGKLGIMSKAKAMTPTTRYLASAAVDSEFSSRQMQFPDTWFISPKIKPKRGGVTRKWTSIPFNPVESDPATLASILLAAFAYRAGHMVRNLSVSLAHKEITWTSALPEVHRICQAHCHFVIVESFFRGIGLLGANSLVSEVPNSTSTNPGIREDTKRVLTDVALFYALSTILNPAVLADFLQIGAPYLTNTSIKKLKLWMTKSMASIRPNAVALCDSWAFSDFQLQSALGRFDGRVYENMFELVSKEPLNIGENAVVVKGYKETFGRILKGEKVEWNEIDRVLGETQSINSKAKL
ncbi:hypothetical protein HK096_002472 [Nowakowskiella sp. JEL0078]|nr:hypothetical protein HK096_002472 [Nowakowskiella sp. JEL0078]